MEQRVDLKKVRRIVFEYENEQRVITQLLLVARHYKIPKEITKMIYMYLWNSANFYYIPKLDGLLEHIKMELARAIDCGLSDDPTIGRTIHLGLIREWIDRKIDHYHDPPSPEDVYFIEWLVEKMRTHVFFKHLNFSVTLEKRCFRSQMYIMGTVLVLGLLFSMNEKA